MSFFFYKIVLLTEINCGDINRNEINPLHKKKQHLSRSLLMSSIYGEKSILVNGAEITLDELAKMIDHSLLKAEATLEEITQLCREAIEWGFGAVCVNPRWVKTCASLLAETPVKVATVIGFPLGATFLRVKQWESELSAENGIDEADLVLTLPPIAEENYSFVEEEVAAVLEGLEAGGEGIELKVIIEAGLWSDDQIVQVCEAAFKGGAHCVKTSTGFHKDAGGATTHHVELMAAVAEQHGGYVKASGGVRTGEQMLAMVGAGAGRIGCSAGIKIMQDLSSMANRGDAYESGKSNAHRKQGY